MLSNSCSFSLVLFLIALLSSPYSTLGFSLYTENLNQVNQPSNLTNRTREFSYNCTFAQYCSLSLSNTNYSQEIANNYTILINITISDECQQNYTSCFRGFQPFFFNPPNFVRSTHPPPLCGPYTIQTQQMYRHRNI